MLPSPHHQPSAQREEKSSQTSQKGLLTGGQKSRNISHGGNPLPKSAMVTPRWQRTSKCHAPQTREGKTSAGFGYLPHERQAGACSKNMTCFTCKEKPTVDQAQTENNIPHVLHLQHHCQPAQSFLHLQFCAGFEDMKMDPQTHLGQGQSCSPSLPG